MTPTFTVALIAKNEAKTLPRLLKSLSNFTAQGGEIILVDTGSTDGTAQVAQDLGCIVFEEGARFTRVIDAETAIKINEKFVCAGEQAVVKDGDKLFNFAAARNYAVSKASHDWVCIIDCDESFTQLNLSAVAVAMESPKAGRIEHEFVYAHDQYGQPTVQFRHARFYNRLKLRWNPECIVHEVQVPLCQSETVYLGPDALKIEHWQNQETNRSGYLVGLALDCFLHPNNDRNSHYFGRELMYKGRYRSAIKELRRHVAFNGWPAERAQSIIFIGDCYRELDQIDDAVDCWYHAFLADGTRREPLMRLAKYYYSKDDKHRTAAYASAALTLPRTGFYGDDESHFRQEPHELLYWALWYLGDKEGSEFHWRKAIGYQPRNPKYLHDAQFYHQHVTICIPTLGREDKLKRLLELIPQTAEYPHYDVVVEHDSFENRAGVPKLLKKMVDSAKGDFVVFLGNDCVPKPGWLRLAMESMRSNFPAMDGLIGLNDGYWHGEFATHWLASKKLLLMLDGEFFHTGYHHAGCDNELSERCRKAGKFVWCKEAEVFHDRPMESLESDAVYDLGRSHAVEDTVLLRIRSEKLGFPFHASYARLVEATV